MSARSETGAIVNVFGGAFLCRASGKMRNACKCAYARITDVKLPHAIEYHCTSDTNHCNYCSDVLVGFEQENSGIEAGNCGIGHDPDLQSFDFCHGTSSEDRDV